MKKLLKKIVSVCLVAIYQIKYKIQVHDSLVFLSRLDCTPSNKIKFENAEIERSSMKINGKRNSIVTKGKVFDTQISIFGNNNRIILESKSILQSSEVIIRGNNCLISIGEQTTFGSVYMVCMGHKNSITIGKECMFSDDIEIWSTDSHPIVNANREIINPSLPIEIGDHVWGGKGCKILKGVKIGDNAIIGMYAIATKELKTGSLNVGIPAKCVKEDINWNRQFIKV